MRFTRMSRPSSHHDLRNLDPSSGVVMITDSTIAPPPKKENRDFFFNERFHGCSTQGRMLLKEKYPHTKYFLVCKGLTIDDLGVSRDTEFQEIRPGAWFRNRRFR